MILELADIRIKPGQQAEFEEAIARGLQTVISKAKGFQGNALACLSHQGKGLAHRQHSLA